MRRLISISLLLFFLMPIASPLFAANPAEANLPACCRRNGKHHCMMALAMRSPSSPPSSRKPALRPANLQEKCPFAPFLTQAPAHLIFTSDEPQAIFYAGIVSHPACHAQTEARLRISFDRSRQKRGPPQAHL